MSLEVIVASASNLPNVESVGKTDPYVSVEYQGKPNHVCICLIRYCYIACAFRSCRFRSKQYYRKYLPVCACNSHLRFHLSSSSVVLVHSFITNFKLVCSTNPFNLSVQYTQYISLLGANKFRICGRYVTYMLLHATVCKGRLKSFEPGYLPLYFLAEKCYRLCYWILLVKWTQKP